MSARLIDIVNGFWEVWFYLVPFLLGFALFHWRKLMRRREMRLFLLLGAFALAWRLILFGSGASHFSSRYLGALALFALPPAVYGARELAAELARRLRAPRLAFPLFLALLLLVGGISVAKPFHRSREKKYLTEAAVGIGRFLRERKLSGPCAVIVGGEPERRLLPGPGGRVLFRDRTVDPESFLVSAVAQTLLNGEYAFLLLGGEPAEAFRRRWALEPVRRYGEKTLYFAAHPPFRDPLHGA
ncbi:MAG: hypothetical protein HPZ91_03360 [Lentisphaeria bacterium]|nr:hypothetical protein [Lentisphaeria bacterium]